MEEATVATTVNTITEVMAAIGGWTPWLLGIVVAIVVTQFLLGLGRWEKAIPWQVRAFTRVLVLVVFVYLLQMGVVTFLPETYAAKLKIFSDGLTLIGDIFKTLMGAVIGALSASMKEADDDDDIKTPPTTLFPPKTD